jgi:hypothetical protein
VGSLAVTGADKSVRLGEQKCVIIVESYICIYCPGGNLGVVIQAKSPHDLLGLRGAWITG